MNTENTIASAIARSVSHTETVRVEDIEPALASIGYSLSDLSRHAIEHGRILISIADNDEEEADQIITKLRAALPDGAKAQWTGNSDTSGEGVTTSDCEITWETETETAQEEQEQQETAAPTVALPYIVSGNVRGIIGRYATIREAAKAADKDSRACRSLSSSGSLTRTYSDVRVHRADGEPLTDDEQCAIMDA